jgi:hypothetical protein
LVEDEYVTTAPKVPEFTEICCFKRQRDPYPTDEKDSGADSDIEPAAEYSLR